MSKSEDVTRSDLGSRLSSIANDTRKSPPPIEIPSMSLHNDLISFLAVAQYYELDFLSITWEIGLGQIGKGGSSEIRQSSLDLEVSLAFKCTARLDRRLLSKYDEQRAFNALVSEISILGHPLIRHHQNIVNLEGICWELPLASQKVLPVLILEKSQLGDLQSFICSEQGRKISFEEKLGLCTDVGSALKTMHQCHMTHGDIKPQNVLVFRDKSRAIFAKLADFGYSGWDLHESKILIKPPRSRPWDAPEYHHHGFSVAQAKLLDIFSFGMLCMWIMFEDKLHAGTFVPLESPDIECASLTGADYSRVFSDQNFTDELKHEGELLKLARQLTGTAKTSTNAQKQSLLRFFDSTLAYDPRHRAWNLEELESLLSPDWMPGPATTDLDQMDINHSKLKFEVSKSFYPLMIAHHRVRKYIFVCLENQATNHAAEIRRMNAAFQLAFCHKAGFGTPSNESLSSHWLQILGRTSKDLDMEIKWASDTMRRGSWRNGNLGILVRNGILKEDTKWIETENMETNEAEYKREIRDIQEVFGKGNPCLLRLKLTLVTLLQKQRKYTEAEKLLIEVLEQANAESKQMRWGFSGSKSESGFDRSRGHAQSGLPRLELKLPMLQSEQPALERIIALADDMIPETLTSIRILAANYWSVGRWKEAEWLYVQMRNMHEREVGECHPDTLSDASAIAELYERQGRWTEAEALISWVWETQKRFLGTEHLHTRRTMSTFAMIYSVQGRTEESMVLKKQLMDICKKLLGDKDPETLLAISNVSIEFAKQGKWKEAEEHTQEALKGRKEILGEYHPDTASSMNSLAAIYQHKGLLTQAETLFLQVIKMEENILGEENPLTLSSKINLALTYKSHGLLGEAENLLVAVVEARERILGEEHPETLNSLASLASVYSAQRKLNKAENLYLHVIEIWERKLSRKHPSCLLSKVLLASVYVKQNRFEEAEVLILPIIEVNRERLGEEHEQTLEAMGCLAESLNGQQRWKEADSVFARVIEKLKRARGPDHWLTLKIMRSRALNLSSQNRCQEADNLFMQIREQATRLPDEHYWLIRTVTRDQVSNFRKHGRWRNSAMCACSYIRWRWDNDLLPGLVVKVAAFKSYFWTQRWKSIATCVLLPSLFWFLSRRRSSNV